MKPSALDLAEAAVAGNRRALAQLLTLIENNAERAAPAMSRLYSHTGRAHIIGITGAPGTGKSTLVAAMAQAWRAEGKTVGIIAVDPTSPFTGGAILGDRIRMRDLSGDEGVFIRSMATRGALGGLAAVTLDQARALDAAGFDKVLIETVGAGQNEVAVARLAQTTLVVEAPGLGDEVQAIKAGILEIADVLVVNKADRPGATQTVRALRTMIETGHPALKTRWMHHGQMIGVDDRYPLEDQDVALWIPPIVETVAADGKGVDLLVSKIEEHRNYLETAGLRAPLERAHLEVELMNRLEARLLKRLLERLPEGVLSEMVTSVQQRTRTPEQAIEALLSQAEVLAVES
ncbi:MAG: methylmalonyl Co-A mutase-associated GTPase MeaB [Anaerolineae bacterium]|nr:methylmalonyl Co-A mutase-associated GTPase MeaB [Anaerolineae bacterium]